MDEHEDDQLEKPALSQSDLDMARFVERMLDDNEKDVASGGGENFGQILKVAFYIIAFIITFASIPAMRVVGIIVGLIAGLYFGFNWLRKGIIRQEVRPFSRVSGFYWMIFSICGAFILFLIARLSP